MGAKMLTKSQRPRFLNLVANSPCTPSQPCPKCALILVIRYRFKVFRERFGREPRPTEPLFFDASKKPPVKASLSDAREQIESGAIAVGVDPAPSPSVPSAGLVDIRRSNRPVPGSNRVGA